MDGDSSSDDRKAGSSETQKQEPTPATATEEMSLEDRRKMFADLRDRLRASRRA